LIALNDIFVFKRCVTILKSTGKRAKNLKQLRDILKIISKESIYHHTYEYFLKGHIIQYTNDFAQWVGESLEEQSLSEQLSNIDPYSFSDINQLRNKIIKTIQEYMDTFPNLRDVIEGEEFCFNESITIVYPIGIKVRNLAEFLIAIRFIDEGCIYYHFYEARTRLGSGIDDFSMWIEYTLNKKSLAEKIRSIDLFMHDINGIREYIIDVVEEEVKRDMEAIGNVE